MAEREKLEVEPLHQTTSAEGFLYLDVRVLKFFAWTLFLAMSLVATVTVQKSGFPFGVPQAQKINCGNTNQTIEVTTTFRTPGFTGGSNSYINTISVSKIPPACFGQVFTIKAIGANPKLPLYLAGDCFDGTGIESLAGQEVQVYFNGSKRFDHKLTSNYQVQPPTKTYSWIFNQGSGYSQTGVAAQLIDSYAYPVSVGPDSFVIQWIGSNDPATFCNGRNSLGQYFSVPNADQLGQISVQVQNLNAAARSKLLSDGII